MDAWPSIVGFGASAGAVVGLSAASGSYYPTAWAWATLAFVGCAALLLAVPEQHELTKADRMFLWTLVAFTAWVGLSALRPGAATFGVPVLERTVLYAVVAGVGIFGCRRAAVPAEALLAGTLAGVVAVTCWGLALVLFPSAATPDFYEGRLLFQPVGYANGMGALAAMGIVLALGVSCHAHRVGARAAAAGSLVPLAAALWFTSSRGASAALAVGLAALVTADPARRRLLSTAVVVSPMPLLAVWLASRSEVSNAHVSAAAVKHGGHVVAAALVLLTVASVTIAAVLLRRERLERIATGAVAVGVIATVVLVVAAVWRGSGVFGDRTQYWHAALKDFRAHPILGSGPGSFAAAWLRYRTTHVTTLNAHNLYLETLAELGPVGLALLASALLLPVRTAIIMRRRPAAAAALGAYAVFLVHSAIDWDWQLPAVTGTALLAAVAITLTSPAERADRPRRLQVSIIAAGAVLVVAGVTVAELRGNQLLTAAQGAAASGNWVAADHRARAAARWQPWSEEPVLLRGLAELSTGRRAAARASFARATRMNPNDWRAWYDLGSVGDAVSRRRALEKIQVLNPAAAGVNR